MMDNQGKLVPKAREIVGDELSDCFDAMNPPAATHMQNKSIAAIHLVSAGILSQTQKDLEKKSANQNMWMVVLTATLAIASLIQNLPILSKIFKAYF